MHNKILVKLKNMGIGSTPLIPYKLEDSQQVELYLKLEFLNPGGSIKDRPASFMVLMAEESKKIISGSTIVEASSGNQGIALALVSARLGYQAVITVPEHTSREKINLLKSYQARVIVCPDCAEIDDPRSHFSVAKRIANEIEGAFLVNQFYNDLNPLTHYLTTAPEIWEQSKGKVTWFISGMGSCGTIAGVGRFLKEKNSAIKVIGVDAHTSKLSSSEPKPYQIEGIGVDILDGNFQLAQQYIDEIIPVRDEDAFKETKKMATQGMLVGLSSGAVIYGVKQVLRRASSNDCIVAIMADSGRSYLSKIFHEH